jgi:spore coat protein U-like protein
MTRVRTLATALLLAAAPCAGAQSASRAVTATVGTSLQVNGLANLAFGTVIPGLAKSIAFSAATSGRMRVSGDNGADVLFTFTLPTVLSNGGGATMPIDSWDIRISRNSNVSLAVPFVVTSGVPTLWTLHASGNAWMFIGGRVLPAGTQAAGNYAGTILLGAAYPGV